MTTRNATALATGTDALVTSAIRCWRRARDQGEPIQRRLYSLLSPLDCGILAPVFDSLLTLSEAALGRRIAIGNGRPSDDELLLLGLLNGTRPRACLDCSKAAASALDCALCSTRIMLTMATGRPAGR